MSNPKIMLIFLLMVNGIQAVADRAAEFRMFAILNSIKEPDQQNVEEVAKYIKEGGDANAIYAGKKLLEAALTRLPTLKQKGPMLKIIQEMLVGGAYINDFNRIVPTLSQQDQILLKAVKENIKRPEINKRMQEAASAQKDAVNAQFIQLIDSMGERNGDRIVEAMRILIKKGVNVNTVFNGAGFNALQAAAMLQDLTVLKFLIEEAKADIESKSKDNKTPLIIALQKKNLGAFKYLVEKGASIPVAYNGEPLFHYIVEVYPKLNEFIDYFLEKNQVNMRDKNGKTPFHILLGSEYIPSDDVIKKFMAKGAKIDIQDNEKKTPMDLAVAEMVKVAHKYNDEYAGEFTEMFISYLQEFTQRINELSTLLKEGATVDLKDSEGNTLLHYMALMKPHNYTATRLKGALAQHLLTTGESADKAVDALVNLLLTKHADVNATNNAMLTPLAMAAANNNLSMVKKLLNAHAQIEAKGQVGTTPLLVAVINGNALIVDVLVEAKANINAQNENGFTPLSAAVNMATKAQSPAQRQNFIHIMEYLLSHGADPGKGSFLAIIHRDQELQDAYLKWKTWKSKKA